MEAWKPKESDKDKESLAMKSVNSTGRRDKKEWKRQRKQLKWQRKTLKEQSRYKLK